MCHSLVKFKSKMKIKSKSKKMRALIACGVCLAILQVVMALDDQTKVPCGVQASPHPLHRDPWLVYLEFYRRGQPTELRCAGALLDARHVLTAAHCVRALTPHNRLYARLGEYRLSSVLDCEGGVCADPVVRILVRSVVSHPDFDGREHDIAVLVLTEDAPYTDFIRPVCLPTGDIPHSFHAAGWGEIPSTGQYADVKKTVPLPYWTDGTCRSAYKHDVIPHRVICAGGEGGYDTCRGDSGGPLMLTKAVTEIWGITVLGSTVCGKEGKPGIYTSVVDYLDWIREARNLT